MARGDAKGTAPGCLRQRSQSYGLHDNVMIMDVPDNVRAACQEVRHGRADVLGLRGPQWQASVHTSSHKFARGVSDSKLSNTLQPQHVCASDFRKTCGITHQPITRLHAPALERSLPAASHTGGWNSSTELDRQQLLRGAEQVTQRSLQHTQGCAHAKLLASSAGRYVSPQQRVATMAQQAAAAVKDSRAEKVNQELEERYGKEGAQAMKAIMQMPGYGQPARPRRYWPSREELQAVEQLPEELACDSLPPRTSTAVSEAGADAAAAAATAEGDGQAAAGASIG